MTTTINNEHKKLNVPNLRFKEFEGEWEKCKLGNIANITGGYAFKSDTLNSIGGKYQVVKMGNLYQNQLDLHRSPSYTDTLTRKAENVILRKDDIAITLTGTNNKRDFGYTYIFNDEKNLLLNQRCGLIRAKGNPYFLSCLLKTHTFLNQFFESATGGTGNQANVSTKAMEMFSVNTPSLKEQEKIGQLMALLDERIATQNKIIEDLKKLKSAISHILFSSKGAIHLSEIANVVMGQSPSSNAYNDQGLGMPLVQGNLDISNGKTTPRLYTAEFNQTTEKGNIILTVRAPVGEVAKATQKVCLGRGVCAIIPHEENMSDFIYQYLTFYKFMWRRYEQGSTFTSINGSDVRNIFCPKVRNVSILTLLDIKINIEERVVKQYQSQKQYMLYQMFI